MASTTPFPTASAPGIPRHTKARCRIRARQAAEARGDRGGCCLRSVAIRSSGANRHRPCRGQENLCRQLRCLPRRKRPGQSRSWRTEPHRPHLALRLGRGDDYRRHHQWPRRRNAGVGRTARPRNNQRPHRLRTYPRRRPIIPAGRSVAAGQAPAAIRHATILSPRPPKTGDRRETIDQYPRRCCVNEMLFALHQRCLAAALLLKLLSSIYFESTEA